MCGGPVVTRVKQQCDGVALRCSSRGGHTLVVQRAGEAAAVTTTHHKVEKSVKRKHECFRCGGPPSAPPSGRSCGSVSRRETQGGQAHFYDFPCDKTYE